MTLLTRRLVYLLNLLACGWATNAMAIEEPAFEVTAQAEGYELRLYDPYLVAETVVEGTLSSSGSRAFRILADYIFGNNSASEKMAMTAPVEATANSSTKMAMTAPVESRQSADTPDTFVYGFVMEAKYTIDTLPMPNSPLVKIRQVNQRLVAAHRFSGRWTQARYDKHEQQLLKALMRDGLTPKGKPMLARFNGPMTPWFMRRNEIQIEVQPAAQVEAH